MAGAIETRNRARLTPSAFRARAAAATVFVFGAVGALAFACGGTTGHEDDPAAPQSVADATVDGTVEVDAGLYDVEITYVDRVLPEASAPQDGGANGEAGYPWPNCAPDIGVGPRGPLIPGQPPYSEIPAVYSDAGVAVAAPDGSPCATYAWLGSAAIDQCVVMGTTYAPLPDNSYVMDFPPCNWCAEAGTAVQGPFATVSRYSICLQLYQCMVQTHCADVSVASCLCGSESLTDCTNDKNPPGPCAQYELGSLEVSLQTPGAVYTALNNFTFQGDPTSPYFCGGTLNSIYSTLNANCSDLLDAGGE
jgi:hypothetical protein